MWKASMVNTALVDWNQYLPTQNLLQRHFSKLKEIIINDEVKFPLYYAHTISFSNSKHS